ncbi:MAG: hypothetical protein PVJ55_04555 [Anaerolineae bacterium]|jgi:hypothetical protein
MPSWRYKITVHEAEEILDHLGTTVDEIPRAIYCDDEGACYFDEGPNPLTQAIEHVLDDVGRQEWELVQVAFRPDQMICFWKQPR